MDLLRGGEDGDHMRSLGCDILTSAATCAVLIHTDRDRASYTCLRIGRCVHRIRVVHRWVMMLALLRRQVMMMMPCMVPMHVAFGRYLIAPGHTLGLWQVLVVLSSTYGHGATSEFSVIMRMLQWHTVVVHLSALFQKLLLDARSRVAASKLVDLHVGILIFLLLFNVCSNATIDSLVVLKATART